MHSFLKLLIFLKLSIVLIVFFLSHSLHVFSKTFAFLTLVLCLHYAITRCMFTVRFQHNFQQITATFVFFSWKLLTVSGKRYATNLVFVVSA